MRRLSVLCRSGLLPLTVAAPVVAMNPICMITWHLQVAVLPMSVQMQGPLVRALTFFGSICVSAVQRGDFEESQLSDLVDAECNNILVTSSWVLFLLKGPWVRWSRPFVQRAGEFEAVCDAAVSS